MKTEDRSEQAKMNLDYKRTREQARACSMFPGDCPGIEEDDRRLVCMEDVFRRIPDELYNHLAEISSGFRWFLPPPTVPADLGFWGSGMDGGDRAEVTLYLCPLMCDESVPEQVIVNRITFLMECATCYREQSDQSWDEFLASFLQTARSGSPRAGDATWAGAGKRLSAMFSGLQYLSTVRGHSTPDNSRPLGTPSRSQISYHGATYRIPLSIYGEAESQGVLEDRKIAQMTACLELDGQSLLTSGTLERYEAWDLESHSVIVFWRLPYAPAQADEGSEGQPEGIDPELAEGGATESVRAGMSHAELERCVKDRRRVLKKLLG